MHSLGLFFQRRPQYFPIMKAPATMEMSYWLVACPFTQDGNGIEADSF